jgi:hypothetical protein
MTPFWRKYLIPFILYILLTSTLSGQEKNADKYWNTNTQLNPFRIPIVPESSVIEYRDLDNDGDPDLLFVRLFDTINAVWIDDDDDMQYGDTEGDTDNDCLLLDLNGDGIFAGPGDLSIDWSDNNNDGIADVQLVVRNGKDRHFNYFDWSADFMYVIDFGENNGVLNYINWNILNIEAWEHAGHANFFTDYHGNTLFLKMHHSSFRIANPEYNWENPFIFLDTDGDELTEVTIRLVDTPVFRKKEGADPAFDTIPEQYEVLYKKRIDMAAVSWDLDNDNGPGNEFDLDMSLRFSGQGFSYENQQHHFPGISFLEGEQELFFDHKWRKINRLYYPGPDTALQMVLEHSE